MLQAYTGSAYLARPLWPSDSRSRSGFRWTIYRWRRKSTAAKTEAADRVAAHSFLPSALCDTVIGGGSPNASSFASNGARDRDAPAPRTNRATGYRRSMSIGRRAELTMVV